MVQERVGGWSGETEFRGSPWRALLQSIQFLRQSLRECVWTAQERSRPLWCGDPGRGPPSIRGQRRLKLPDFSSIVAGGPRARATIEPYAELWGPAVYQTSTSSVKFILKYFVLFDAIVSGIVFLISFSDHSLIVYKTRSDFYISALYSPRWFTNSLLLGQACSF